MEVTKMDEIKLGAQLTVMMVTAMCLLWFGLATGYFMIRHPKANQYAVFGHFIDVMVFSADVEGYK